VFSPVLVESLQRLLARLTQLLHLFVPRVLPTFGVEGGRSGSRFVVPLNGTKVDLIQSPALFMGNPGQDERDSGLIPNAIPG